METETPLSASLCYAASMPGILGNDGLLLAALAFALASPGTAPTLHAQTAPAQGPLLLTLEGRGVQVYRCNATASPAAWVLDHPEADLLDSRAKVVGHHDAGPSWQMEDGSRIKGEVLEKTPAPGHDAIPWLLLRVTNHQGAGSLASVETVRRTNTEGGLAPVQGCDQSMAGADVRVPYRATYTFYSKP